MEWDMEFITEDTGQFTKETGTGHPGQYCRGRIARTVQPG
jgi:hypothetical protein